MKLPHASLLVAVAVSVAMILGMILAVIMGARDQSATLAMPEPGFERMIEQPRVDPYTASRHFQDGAAMRWPPADTVARDSEPVAGEFATGRAGADYVTAPPLPLDLIRLRRGEERYAICCAVCHGLRGDGESPIASAMTVLKPRNLLIEPFRSYPVGRIFQVTRNGYGVMSGYAAMLNLEDAWAVAAYVQVLQLANAVRLADLPQQRRRELLERLP